MCSYLIFVQNKEQNMRNSIVKASPPVTPQQTETLFIDLQLGFKDYLKCIMENKDKVTRSSLLTNIFCTNALDQLQETIQEDNRSEDSQEIKRFLSESSNSTEVNKDYLMKFKKWKDNQHNNAFKDIKEVTTKYMNTFFVGVSSVKSQQPFSQQRKIIQGIYNFIKKKSNDQYIKFDKIQQFFQNSPIFCTIFQIQILSLPELLQIAAQTQKDSLTLDEFILMLLRQNQQIEFQQKTEKCILTDEDWADLRQMFNTLDIYGRDEVTCYKILRILQRNNDIVNKVVIQFGCGRNYTFANIISQLYEKTDTNNNVSWNEFKKLVSQFKHIQQPTIDVIYQRKIYSAEIDHKTNSFLISQECIKIIKNICNKIGKRWGQFYDMKQFCAIILQKYPSTHKELVRKKPFMTIKDVIIQMKQNAPKYLNKDQILAYFSIRGSFLKNTKQEEEIESEEEQKPKKKKIVKIKEKKKEIKKSPPSVTVPHEFKLTEKKIGIRARKVEAMFKEMDERDQIELKKKFKASVIPISNNNQKYQEYQNQMKKKKQSIMDELAQSKDAATQLLRYLEANTKLFQEKKKLIVQNVQFPRFEASTIPWHLHEPLLQKIQSQKQERRNNLKHKLKEEYRRYWHKLPDAMDVEQDEESIIQSQEKQPKKIIRKVKEVPNFAFLHKQFQEELKRKKMTKNPTIVKQFNITKKEEVVQKENKQCKRSLSNKIKHIKKYEGVRSTIKFDSMVAARINQQNKQQQKKEIQKQQTSKKQKQKKQFAKYVQNKMRKELKRMGRKKNKIMRRVKTKPINMKQIYERILSRPFMFESKSSFSSPKIKKVNIPFELQEQQIPKQEQIQQIKFASIN